MADKTVAVDHVTKGASVANKENVLIFTGSAANAAEAFSGGPISVRRKI
jgi:microcompartment protein CcmK/EutM